MPSAHGQTRRERTFVGNICVVCDEPLEHMLRGEHILQLTCGHVSHEACLYEYIRGFAKDSCPVCNAPLEFDTSRGGNIDYDSLHKLIELATNTQPQWKQHDSVSTTRSATTHSDPFINRRSYMAPMVVNQEFPPENESMLSYGSRNGHYTRASKGSDLSSTRSAEAESVKSGPTTCKNCEDVHAANAPTDVRQLSTRFPIPEPMITLRSEFPSITRSRVQQTLTCMITIEVPESTWPKNPISYQYSSVPLSPTIEEDWTKSASTNETLVDAMETGQDLQSQAAALEAAKESLLQRVDDWHELDPQRFGKLLLFGPARVGKDQGSWQDLDCYLFTEMLVCVKEKKNKSGTSLLADKLGSPLVPSQYYLKGSILIRKHLDEVEVMADRNVLTLRLSAEELPTFNLLFHNREELDLWSQALHDIDWDMPLALSKSSDIGFAKLHEHSISAGVTDIQSPSAIVPPLAKLSRSLHPDYQESGRGLSGTRSDTMAVAAHLHVPMDIVIVFPVSTSGHSLKVNILRDCIRFVLSILSDCDRLAVVSFGGDRGAHNLVKLSTTHSIDWTKKLEMIRATDYRSHNADVMQGVSVAMDILERRRSANPLAHILLISDAVQADDDSSDKLVSRAVNLGVSIHTFGLGMTHKPDDLISLSSQSKASYIYVKDWMMLRECLAGCVGSLQSTSHPGAKVYVRIPEGSNATLVKVTGALQTTNTSGRSAEISLGDLRHGDRRDILVQLSVQTDKPTNAIQDPWDSIISDMGGTSPIDGKLGTAGAIEEIPLLEVDLEWGDVLHGGRRQRLAQESLLAITQLPLDDLSDKSIHSPITSTSLPPHPCIQQRRLELLTSDMLARALSLVDKGQIDRASHLVSETRSVLQGLWKRPSSTGCVTPSYNIIPITPKSPARNSPAARSLDGSTSNATSSSSSSYTSQRQPVESLQPVMAVDPAGMAVLDHELSANLEWISHPEVFARDARKTILQAIGVISSQRGYTCRSPAETLWASRIAGVKRALERSREWRELTRNVHSA